MKNRKGFTYLVHAENLLRFKIGLTKNCDRRFTQLQSCSPIKLFLIAKKNTNDMYEEEKKWHSMFSKSKVRSEWFDLTYNQLYKITKNWKAEFGIHWKNRVVDNLIIGNNYYISFDGVKTIEVILEVKHEKPPNTVSVISKDRKTSWTLYDDGLEKQRFLQFSTK